MCLSRYLLLFVVVIMHVLIAIFDKNFFVSFMLIVFVWYIITVRCVNTMEKEKNSQLALLDVPVTCKEYLKMVNWITQCIGRYKKPTILNY